MCVSPGVLGEAVNDRLGGGRGGHWVSGDSFRHVHQHFYLFIRIRVNLYTFRRIFIDVTALISISADV